MLIQRTKVSAAVAVMFSMLALSACDNTQDPARTLAAPVLAFTAPGTTIDIANYRQIAAYDLPVRASSAETNQLAEEASAVTFDVDDGTLYVVGDEGTGIVRVNKLGERLDTMALSGFEDTEGITYIGGGQFVLVEERLRQLTRFTYAGGGTLTAGAAQPTVKLSPTVGNIGLEGVSFDPKTGGYIGVKESGPQGVFQTGVNFTTLTATNPAVATAEPANLFDPAKAGLSAFSDVYALSNIVSGTPADSNHLLILGRGSGKVVQIDRSGNIAGTLEISVAGAYEGITMDNNGVLYLVGEDAGVTGNTAATIVPGMTVFEPTTDKYAVGTGSNFYLTFAENVVRGAGDITLIGRRTGGRTDVRVIPVTDTAQVSIDGRTVKINPAQDLLPGVLYSATFPAGLVTGTDGAPAPGVSDPDELEFLTHGAADNNPPLLSSSLPADNALNTGNTQLVLTFNEPVHAGGGNIVVASAGDTRTIPVGDAQVVFSDNTVTVTFTAPLDTSTAYNVQIADAAILDKSANAYAGIASATVLNFVTAPPPTVLNAGDIAFLGGDSDAPDAYAFVLLKAVNLGTQIQFTDKDYKPSAAGDSTHSAEGFPFNESAYTWTADVAYPAGTIITIQQEPLGIDRGSIAGTGGGLSTAAETIYAFQGKIVDAATGKLTVDRFLAAMNIGDDTSGDIPSDLTTAGAFLNLGTVNNYLYGGSLDRSDLGVFAARVRDTANYGSSATAYPLVGKTLFPDPSGPTTLNPGDLLFMGSNIDGGGATGVPDGFAFVLMKDINAGTTIGFSDRDITAGEAFPATGEASYMWTADVAYPAGTIITVASNSNPPVFSAGTAVGTGGGMGDPETVYAFQGTITGVAITVDRFIASMNAGGAAAGLIPAALVGVADLTLPNDNNKYTGSLDRSNLNAFRSLVANPANFTGNDTTPVALTFP